MHISRLMLSLLLAPVASAGVIVVDSNNGPGTDFTALGPALTAAQNGDVLLLRGSFQGSFLVSGKSISLVADTGASVSVSNPFMNSGPALQIGNDVDGQVVVRGLSFSTASATAVPLVGTGTAGSGRHLFIEECTAPGGGTVAMQFNNHAPVTLSHCTATGGDGHVDGLGLPVPGTSALVLGEGPAVVYGGSFTGGNGLPAGVYGGLPIAGQDGQNGIVLASGDNSFKLLGGALCIGGLGGDGVATGCLSPGNGGNGVLATLGTNAKVLNLFGLGNFGGKAAPGCGADGLFGNLLAAVAPAQLPTWQNGGSPTAVATRVVREGGAASVSVEGGGGDQAALLVGTSLQFATLPTFGGVELVQPLFTVPLGALPFPGTLTVSDHIAELGPGIESLTVFVQVVTKDTLNRKVFGQPTAMLLLDSQF
jgi:hypothetical protein